MNKTLLLALPPLLTLTACVEPERHGAGDAPSADTETADDDDDDADDDADDGKPDDGDDGDPGDDGGETDGDGGETDGGGNDDGAEGGGPEEPACDLSTSECIDPVPAGWNGPVRAKASGTDAACGGGWDTAALGTFDSVHATASSCTCECGEPSDGLCNDETAGAEFLYLANVNHDTCEEATDEFNLDESWVNPWGADSVGWYVQYTAERPAVIAAGDCSPDPSSYAETHYTVLHDGYRTMCGAEQLEDLGACAGDGLCVPRGDERFEPGVCIWQEGDVECPDDTFTERRVAFTDVLDTRECGLCSCGPAQGEACSDARVRVTASPQTHLYYFDADGSCQDIRDDQGDFFAFEYIHSLHLEPGEPSGGSCPGTREAYGGVEAVDPVTICCTA